MQDLKQYIKDNLLTRTGGINAAITRREHFINSEIVKSIINETSSLDLYNPSIGDRIKAILIDYKVTKCPICEASTKLFSTTCGKKECMNASISNNKKSNIDLLENNNDNDNKIQYFKLTKEDIENSTNKCLQYIKDNLRKSNDHLNIERINKLNTTNIEFIKDVCILTYFCDNYKHFDIYRRIKLILLDIRNLDYCNCGNIKGLSDESNKMFLPTCGEKECVYKVVANHTRNNSAKVAIIKRNNRLTRDEACKDEFDNFIENIDCFECIEFSKFKSTLLQISNSKETSHNILGSNLSYIQFSNNSEIIKNLLYHTRYINITMNNLSISQRVYHILNDLKEIPKCKKCNKVLCNFISPTVGYSTYCIDCRCSESVSKIELSIVHFINTLNVPLQHSNRTLIAPLELDIVIPSKKLAIEFNGNYWHSEAQGKTTNYHLNKTVKCEQNNYRLIHIFEDEWCNKQQIVKSRLKTILGVIKRSIFARKCEVREIDNKIKTEFLDKYHIQGSDTSSIRLGLFYKNRLVAVMTFGTRRFDDKEGFELIRYCTVSNFNIVGGAGKLLSYFRKTYNKENLQIISYADRRWSEGNLYKQLGFTLLRQSTPNYFYIKLDGDMLTRHNRIQFQKHKLKDKLPIFDENLTEVENMRNNGYTRIFDCGSYVFTL